MYNIVICDDEATIRNGLKSLIEKNGRNLRVAGTASNGFEACKVIGEIKPEVVLMDINMPGLNGLDVIQEMSPSLPFTKFIIISGYDEFQYAQKAVRLKAYDYLLKPIDKKNLFVVIENACNSCVKEKKVFADDLITKKPTLADKAVNFIYENYCDCGLTLGSIAKKLHVSESYLTRIIKKKTSMSFSGLLTKVRMEAAISLLMSDNSMTSLEISEKTGYKSQHYFCKVFKAYTGLTPTCYRKNHLGKE
ncbi:MAG TPA: hypothetical protein DCM73_13445 [Clostridiales bacterium]|nr:hypothetical protein [Clostridiales bacterium]